MADSERGIDALVVGLQASGFPFQTAVASVVRQSSLWSLVEQEFPWQDPGGGDHFLDLVAERHADSMIAAIECKKSQKESFVFLKPDGFSSTHGERMRCVFAYQIQDMTRRLELACDEFLVTPNSAEAAFCVVSTSVSGKDQRLLERDAQVLVRATDAYAQERRRRFKPGSTMGNYHVFVPVLVTNAPLFIASYRPTDVALDSGRLDISKEKIEPAPWVRFHKAFTSTGGRDLGARTVLVANAVHLEALLRELGSHVDGPNDRGRVRLPAAVDKP